MNDGTGMLGENNDSKCCFNGLSHYHIAELLNLLRSVLLKTQLYSFAMTTKKEKSV